MGKPRGPKPKPTAVKKALGNPGKRPAGDWVKPAQPSDVLPPPSHLDKIAIAEWRRISRELHQLGILTAVDRAAFAAYCTAWSTYVQAQKAIDAMGKADKNTHGGLMIETSNGNLIQNPMVGIRNTAQRDMLRFAGEFGLTPVARVRVGDVAPGAAAAAARAKRPVEAGKGESYFAD